MSSDAIIQAIETSPLNRGLKGADWLADERNIAIVQGDDIVLFDYEGEGLYQIHLLLESRGRKAITAIREAFRRMFDDHGAQALFGMVPDFRRDVKLVSRWVGGRPAGKRSTEYGPCELFIVAKTAWKGEAS